MGQFVPAQDTVVTTFLWEQGGVLMSIMPSFRRVGGGINIFNLTAFNSLLDTKFIAEMQPYWCSDCTYQLTQSRRQHTISDIAASTSANAGTIGGLGTHAPNVLAFRYELVTETPGRPFSGSLYWPSIALDGIEGDEYNADILVGCKFALNRVKEYVLTVGWEWVVRSKWLGGVARSACLVTRIAAIQQNDHLLDVQRRRKALPPDADGDMMVSFE